MFSISGRMRVTLENGQGYIHNVFIWWRDHFAKLESERCFFGKWPREVGGSLRNRIEGKGLRAKMPFFFLLTSRIEEGG